MSAYRVRRALVRRTVAAWQLRHPELREPLTLAGLERVCEREHFVIRRSRTDRWCFLGHLIDLRAYEIADTAVITVNCKLTGAAQLSVICHEIGHAALHTRDRALFERYQADVKATSYWYEENGTNYLHMGEPPIWRMVETEADLFSDLMLGSTLATAARAELTALERAA